MVIRQSPLESHVNIETHIPDWRSQLESDCVDPGDFESTERQLVQTLARFAEMGLDEDECWLLATRRLRRKGAISESLAREWSNRLWKASESTIPSTRSRDRAAFVAVVLALVAALAFRLPELFGVSVEAADGANLFYTRNFAVLVFPFVLAWFSWRRPLPPRTVAVLLLPFLLGAAYLNVYPFRPGGHTELLSSAHTLIALWLFLGTAHAAGAWRDLDRRAAFVRFSGGVFIHYVLIALGGGVFAAITLFLFDMIGMNAKYVVTNWILPCGVAGAVVISVALADVTNRFSASLASALTLVFVPLFTLLLLVFLGALIAAGGGFDAGREVLVGFDILLVLVAGLLLYAVVSRDRLAPPGAFDRLLLLFLVLALVANGLALWAMFERIAGFGFSPNRATGLGMNLVLVVNLVWAAILQARFVTLKSGFDPVMRWQMAYFPVYATWAVFVAVVFPPLFGFV